MTIVRRAHNTADIVILGAGAAGLMCAGIAGQRGRSVMLLEQARAPGEKIRISGGGRCNFTNLHTTPANFLSQNPQFCKSALKGFTQQDFIALVEKYRIAYHEKTRGQLFCDGSSQQIIDMLLDENRRSDVQMRLGVGILGVTKNDSGFVVATDQGEYRVSVAGGRHRRAVDPENGRQCLRLQAGAAVRAEDDRAARRIGAVDLRRCGACAIQGSRRRCR